MQNQIYWSSNVLTNIVLMFYPEDCYWKLKLWSVSKNFYKACEQVKPYQQVMLGKYLEEVKQKIMRLEDQFTKSRYKNSLFDLKAKLRFDNDPNKNPP